MILSELAHRHHFTSTGVLHVGAAEMGEAGDYASLGIKRVVWVEARPSSPERRAKARRFGHNLVEGIALSDRVGKAKFRVANNGVSSSLLPFKEHTRIYPDVTVTQEITVETKRADGLWVRFPIEINTLVTDVQGSDLAVIKGMGKLLDQISVIICEVFITELYQGSDLKPAIESYLAYQGFSMVEFEEVCKGEWGNALFIRNSPPPPPKTNSNRDRAKAIEVADGVEGLMTRQELEIMADLLPDVPCPRVLETGAWLGRSATLWHQLGAVVFTIDDWSGLWATPTKSDQWLTKFLAVTNPEITPIKVNTIKDRDAALTTVRLLFSVRKADLVFIDADHSYEGVKSDIALALAAIGPRGVIAGHDIDFGGVSQAVQETWPGRWKALGPKLWRVV